VAGVTSLGGVGDVPSGWGFLSQAGVIAIAMAAPDESSSARWSLFRMRFSKVRVEFDLPGLV